MDERPRDSLDLNLPCDRQSPAAVRQAMGWLGSVGPRVGDAMLLASELVTDVVRHSGGTERDAIDVVVRGFDQHLLISVRGPRVAAHAGPAPTLAKCAAEGLGRRIIDGLTSRWGSERRDGYVLWAELPMNVYASVT